MMFVIIVYIGLTCNSTMLGHGSKKSTCYLTNWWILQEKLKEMTFTGFAWIMIYYANTEVSMFNIIMDFPKNHLSTNTWKTFSKITSLKTLLFDN